MKDDFFDEIEIENPPPVSKRKLKPMSVPTRHAQPFAWHKDLEPLPDNSKLPWIMEMILAIQYSKEKHYGQSWRTRGEYRGIIPNIDRKYDRLDKITQDEIDGKIRSLAELEKLDGSDELTVSEVESKIDAVADLASYSLLYMTYLQENYPKMFQIWVDRNVPKELIFGDSKE